MLMPAAAFSYHAGSRMTIPFVFFIRLNVLHEYVIISIYVFSFFADIPNPVIPVNLPFPPLNCPINNSMVPTL